MPVQGIRRRAGGLLHAAGGPAGVPLLAGGRGPHHPLARYRHGLRRTSAGGRHVSHYHAVVRHFLLYLHVFGFILWMGGGFAAMSTGIFMQQLPRKDLGIAVEVQARLMRGLILPGAVMVVLSGLVLTLRLYGSATSVSGFPAALMVMQAAGLIGAGITLTVSFPAITRLSRLEIGRASCRESA